MITMCLQGQKKPQRVARDTLALFGGFRLTFQHHVTNLDHRPRIQSLLAFLALNHQRPQTRVEVISALWPDVAESQGRNRLRNLLYQFRQIYPTREALICIKPTTLQWCADESISVDVVRFEAALAQAAECDGPAETESHLTKAIEQYGGDLFPNCTDAWIDEPRRYFFDRLTQALVELIGLAEARSAWAAAKEYAEQLLAHDPCREATYCRLMQLYANLGDRASIVQAFERCHAMLRQELNVEPSEATHTLYTQLTVVHPSPRSLQIDKQRNATPAALIGRANEWMELHQNWHQVQGGESKLVVIQGEAGIGKTRLCQDFFMWAEQETTYATSANCYAVEGSLAFAPVAEWLRSEPFWQSLSSLEDEWLAALARLLPELLGRFHHLTEGLSSVGGLQRQHFFTALAVALLEHGQPVLLCLDDLQWADQETLDWLHYLIRYETPTPLLVLATLRTDDAAERERCQPLIRELARRNQVSEIGLKPLSIRDTTALARQILGTELYTTYAAQLYHETDGNPFYIVETVRAHPHTFVEAPAETRAVAYTAPYCEQENPPQLPPKIRSMIEQRLAKLSPLASEVMQFAAVIGRRFDYTLLVAVTGRNEEELVNGMEELWAQHVVREAIHNHFEFIHDKVRAVADAQISPLRHRFLHKRIATTLAARQDEQTDAACLQIAQHYHRAGLWSEAAAFYQRAVHEGARRYAIGSLLSASSIALNLLQKLDPEKQDRKGLYEQVDLIHERIWSWEMVGNMDAYLQDLDRLTEIGTALDDREILNRESRYRAAALVRLGRYEQAKEVALISAANYRTVAMHEEEGISRTIVGRAHRELGEFPAAIAAFRQALDALKRAKAHNYRIQAYSYLSTTYWLMEDYAQALECGKDALAICEEQNMPERKRFAWGDMGAAAAMLGQSASAHQWLNKSLDLARIVFDSPQKVFCRGHLGWLALNTREFETAEDELMAAYELSQRADTINYASWILRGLARVALATGEREKASAFAKQALSVAKRNRQASEYKAVQRLVEELF